MSLVGTRPPTVDEWDKYELHHRARLATKPGLTGMWQVSGRSNITDFEEVVKLDKQYISEWTMGLDIKILWVIFLIINTLQSYDINASKNILPIFIIGGLFGFFSWRESTAQAYIKIIRVICLFFAFSILLELIAPNFILSLSNM